MAINIFPSIDDGKPEWAAANRLRTKLMQDWNLRADTPIQRECVDIHVNLRIPTRNNSISNFDILLVIDFAPSHAREFYFDNYRYKVTSLITVIEHKSHSPDGVRYTKTGSVEVRYGNNWENATEKNEAQKYALLNYFAATPEIMGNSSAPPWISNLVWLENVIIENEPYLSNAPHKIIGSDMNMNKFMERIFNDHPRKGNRIYATDQNFMVVRLRNNLQKLFTPTMLDLRRMNLLKDPKFLENDNCSMIYRGHGGTGKTIGLIKKAIDSHTQRNRVLFLSFNKMLIFEVRRLISILNLDHDENFEISTISAWIRTLLMTTGLLEKDENLFKNSNTYENKCNELSKDDWIQLLQGEISIQKSINFQIVCIDEAQDVPEYEKLIIKKLFKNARILIADGIGQFVRGIPATNWKEDGQFETKNLNVCHRLKKNLATFANSFAQRLGFNDWKVEANEQALGGKVFICYGNQRESLRELLPKIYADNTQQGNCPLDLLHCINNNLYHEHPYNNTYLNELKELGFDLWDGIESQDNLQIMKDNLARLVTLDQCRGLEGWAVVAVGLDKFFERKLAQAQTIIQDVNYAQQAYKRFAANFLMIVLTRAMDTIVLQIDDENSTLGLITQKLASDFRAFVEIKR